MKLISVFDPCFQEYGRIVTEFDCAQLLEAMKSSPVPENVLYIPSVPELEELPVFAQLQEQFYGGLPIQMGFTNGHNRMLDALEYHRSSEWNLACTDVVLLLGLRRDVDPVTFTYDTEKVKAFYVPAGVAFETYATTLHYAPCSYEGRGYQFVVVLPKDTNLPLQTQLVRVGEGALMTARNKWLIAHPESGLDPETTFFGLIGENLTV